MNLNDKIKKVAIIDPGLLNRAGHHYIYDLAITRELAKRDIESIVYVYSGINQKILQDFPVRSVFRDYLYNGASQEPYETCRMLENFFIKNNILYHDLITNLPYTNFSKSDTILFHTINQNALFGIIQWLSGFQSSQQPLIVICYQINVPENLELLIPSLYRFTLKRLNARNSRIVFCASSEELAKVYERIGGITVETVPYPVDPSIFGINTTTVVPAKSGKLRIAYLGHSVPRRGVDLLPAIVSTAFNKDLDIEFLIQLSNPEIPFITNIGKSLSNYGGRVRVVYGDLSEDDYFSYLRSADIVLLPYSQENYSYCHSGAFSDAMGLGKVIVCPGDTWMARQMAAFDAGGGSFDAYTPHAICDALARVVIQYETLLSKAKTASLRWLAHHNAASLVDRILEFAVR